jgi:hypothetical protein
MTAPNTQPIYSKEIFLWTARLTSQVTPRILTTATTPTFLGNVGTNGGVIWSIKAVPIGNNVASVLRLYGRSADATALTDYRLFSETNLPLIDNEDNTLSLPEVDIPLPRIFTRDSDQSRGIVAPAGYGFAVALGTIVASGWDIIVTGGDY